MTQDFLNMVIIIDTLTADQAKEVYSKMHSAYEKMDDLTLSMCLYKITERIMTMKHINPELHAFYEDCIKDVIRISVHRRFTVGSEALRIISIA